MFRQDPSAPVSGRAEFLPARMITPVVECCVRVLRPAAVAAQIAATDRLIDELAAGRLPRHPDTLAVLLAAWAAAPIGNIRKAAE
jgi:hypothetical protein